MKTKLNRMDRQRCTTEIIRLLILNRYRNGNYTDIPSKAALRQMLHEIILDELLGRDDFGI